MLALFFMWFAGSVPLVMMGAFFGYRKDKYKFPIGVNVIAREVWLLYAFAHVELSCYHNTTACAVFRGTDWHPTATRLISTRFLRARACVCVCACVCERCM